MFGSVSRQQPPSYYPRQHRPFPLLLLRIVILLVLCPQRSSEATQTRRELRAERASTPLRRQRRQQMSTLGHCFLLPATRANGNAATRRPQCASRWRESGATTYVNRLSIYHQPSCHCHSNHCHSHHCHRHSSHSHCHSGHRLGSARVGGRESLPQRAVL